MSNVFENLSFGKCVLFPNWVNIEFSTLMKNAIPFFLQVNDPPKKILTCIQNP